MIDFNTVTEFEQTIAEFFGATEAVAVDCCTHGIELCLRLTQPQQVTCPEHTYISIPFTFEKLNLTWQWERNLWSGQYLIGGTNIVDAASLWERGQYQSGTMTVLSFQFQKAMKLGRGGMILLDDTAAAQQLRAMSYDGRQRGTGWREQQISQIGYHYYMTPETAQLGLDKLPAAIQNTPRQWVVTDWPDLTQMKIFKRS
jgi:dTDP-4-amino-4,6-dideoxygalactose transaminase